MSTFNAGPNTQDPNSPLYTFVNTQPADQFPVDPPAGDSSLSHFTLQQLIPTAITAARPPVVTYTYPGLPISNGQAVRATQFITMPLANATGMQQLNNQLFYAYQCTSTTFALYDKNTLPIDGRNFTPYISGGQFTIVGQDLLTVNPSEFPPLGVPPFPPV